MNTFLKNNWLALVAIAMLAGALASSFSTLFTLPFAYYQLMNWAVMISAIMITWQSYKSKKAWLVGLFGIVAVVFNPIASIYLSAFAWQVADIIVILLFIGYFVLVKESRA
ncbi:MAG: hypothetical protein Q7S10_00670 [bacterium]|nr:hypothetical protein [bacterium]